jgi:hypothetical protein
MSIAAISAVAFSFVRLSPLALISAISVAYGIGAGILALRARKGIWKRVEKALAVVPIALALAFAALLLLGVASGQPIPPFAIIVGVLVVAIFAYLFWSDIRYLRNNEVSPFDRFRRHAARMALAAAETVRAPLISFGPPIFGELTGAIYFVGPFLLIPLIYYGAMPLWVKRGELQRAQQIELRRLREESPPTLVAPTAAGGSA